MRRVGLFGGTFDPPHLGHLVLAEWARVELDLDRVVFMPAGAPPHKRGRLISTVADRIQMTRLAVRGNPAFAVSTLEARRRGPSYTVDTLRALRARHPTARLFLILGEDSLAELETWREPAAILELATLAVAPRNAPGGAAGHRRGPPRRPPSRPRGRAGAVVWLASPILALASSAIRERARRRRSLRYLVPAPVAAFIARRRLYRRR